MSGYKKRSCSKHPLVVNQLHIVPDIAVSSGGRGLASLRYAEALSKAGANVTVLATSPHIDNLFKPTFHSPAFRIINFQFEANPLGSLLEKYKSINKLCKQNIFDLIHLHGGWLPLFGVAAIVSQKRKIPFVISPHGCFEPWALSQKRTKKLIALNSYQGFINRAASMFFATATQEVESLRRMGVSQPIAIIPVGVDVAEPPKRTPHEGKRSILFLSRIHPVKGLLDLVEAWAQVRCPNWKIVIAGPDEGGHKSEVEKLIRCHGLESDFVFLGLVDGETKQACFTNADLFVLPSYSENFGISVVEALANELPVITTTGAPWKDLEIYRCGWWVKPGVAGISAALQSAMGTPPAELECMGQRGRQLIMDKYTLSKIGKDALMAYEWMLCRSNFKPDFVDVAKVEETKLKHMTQDRPLSN